MLLTFLRYFLIVGVTTTLVLIFCDTQEGQRLLGKAGLFLDQHGVPNNFAEAEKQAHKAPVPPRLQLVQIPESIAIPSYDPRVYLPVTIHKATSTVSCVGKA